MLDDGGAAMLDGGGCVIRLCLEGEKKNPIVTKKVTFEFLSLKSLTPSTYFSNTKCITHVSHHHLINIFNDDD